ncbi:MAG: hypothetical protein ACI89J_001578, partial [Hyphomicrobiaceae bacterium]
MVLGIDITTDGGRRYASVTGTFQGSSFSIALS